MNINKFKIIFLFIGDVIALYAALFASLFLRYGEDFYNQFVDKHLLPFSIIFIVWLAVFYIAGLYDLRRLRNNLEFFKNLSLTMAVNAVIAALFFYFIPALGITPKTNLFTFIVIFSLLEFFWRRSFNRSGAERGGVYKVLLVEGGGANPIKQVATEHPEWLEQLGYELAAEVDEGKILERPKMLHEFVKKINFVVIPRHLKNDKRLTRVLYELLNAGTEISDIPDFYEIITRKIPLEELEESWFLENLAGRQRFYDPLKKALEFLAALALGLALSPLEAALAVAVKATSPGPVIYKQKRVGKNGRPFVLYKFRTMFVDAEKGGAQWAEQDDKRVTILGKILRYSHLDELPQLLNILNGDLSFVGPRPERPEFVEVLKEKIPYYEVRLLVKPGVTGWAQIHHRADVSEEDVMEKLEYDIYYIKNRSPILDLAIILKTIKTLFITPK